MEASGAVRQDLGDLCLDVSLINWSPCFLKKFHCLTEILNRFLVSFFSKLVITLLFKSGNLLF